MRYINTKQVLEDIDTVEDLKYYLRVAIQLEHATLPPYLTAMYSIHPGTNKDAYDLFRVIVVEEMLHLTLAANMLNAVGGKPDLTVPDFVPNYPTYLPSGEEDFKVSLEKFSKGAIDTFMNIERPAKIEENSRVAISSPLTGLMKLKRANQVLLPAFYPKGSDEEHHYYSIGEFYHAIGEGMRKLTYELGEENLFCGDKKKQITEEYYYSGGGEIIPVYSLQDALDSIRLISEQGEGHDGGIYDSEDELSHYYRFQQIGLGKYYHKGDEPDHPTGEKLQIDYDAVYPIKTNAKVSDFPEGSELRDQAAEFNSFYAAFLKQLTETFDGNPRLLIQAVGTMFRIKDMSYSLMRNEIPGTKGTNGAPTFEIQ